MEKIDDFVELVSFIQEKNDGIYPTGLTERIKALEGSILDELLTILQSMELDESKCFNSMQRAVVQIVEMSALPKFADAMVGIISQLDNEKTDDDTFMSAMSAVKEIGESMLEKLVQKIENGDKKGQLYGHLILTLGKIASENKSEKIYSLLKDYFRKSDTKIFEANALAFYGDGRAIPAIRGYVERNIDDLSYWEYSQFRNVVSQLGGNMTDLDGHFDNYEDFSEYDEYDEHDEDEEYMS